MLIPKFRLASAQSLSFWKSRPLFDIFLKESQLCSHGQERKAIYIYVYTEESCMQSKNLVISQNLSFSWMCNFLHTNSFQSAIPVTQPPPPPRRHAYTYINSPLLLFHCPARRRGWEIVNQSINHFFTTNKMKESTFICWSALSTLTPLRQISPSFTLTCCPHITSCKGDFESCLLPFVITLNLILLTSGKTIQLKIRERAENPRYIDYYDACVPPCALPPVVA